MRAVDLKRHQVVAPDPHAPRRVDMRDRAAFELERRVRSIVGGGLVPLAVLVDTLGDMGRAQTGDAAHAAEQVVEHVAPVAQHVEDDAAAFFRLVVPRRPVDRLQVALEHPVAELAAHRQDASEEARVDQHLQLEQTGQPQLVLHHAVLDARLLRRAIQIERLGKIRSHRLFAVDVLAQGDRALEQRRAHQRGRGIEEQRVVLVGQRLIEVGAPALDVVRLGQRLQFVGAASDQDRIGHHARAVGQSHAALLADRGDRARQMLIGAHPPRDTVHDDAEAFLAHMFLLIESVSRRNRRTQNFCRRITSMTAALSMSPSPSAIALCNSRSCTVDSGRRIPSRPACASIKVTSFACWRSRPSGA